MDWSDIANIEITYRLLNIKGFGTVQANRLLWQLSDRITSPSQFEETILNVLKPGDRESFMASYDLYRPDIVSYLSILDHNLYPERLKKILRNNAPIVLSCMGNLDLLKKPSVGISGSRKVSDKGVWITRDCATQFAKKDICVISGYANGVDLEAHRNALENGGSTIIVLPEGISSFRIRKELKHAWDWQRTLVISEFMPEDRWLASRAMRRNQTIIALSDAMMVIEAGETGGSLDAGMKTINYGKNLFVPLYSEVPESAAGNTTLIRMGASKLMRRDNHANIDIVVDSIHRPNMHSDSLPI